MANKVIKNIVLDILLDEIGGKHQDASKMLKLLHRKSKLRRIILIEELKKIPRRIPKITNYFNVIMSYPEDVFQSHLRMTRRTFNLLIKILEPHWESLKSGIRISLESALLVTIWKISNQCSFRTLSDRFNISRGYGFKIVITICKLFSNLMGTFIRWPEKEEMTSIMQRFDTLRGSDSFPAVIGCIDGMHIPILTPKEDPSSYFNQNKYHSVILQISEEDEYPNGMCSGCMSRLEDAYLLKKQAQRSYDNFQDYKYKKNEYEDEESLNICEEYEGALIVKKEIVESTELEVDELSDSNCIDSSTDAVEFLSSESKISPPIVSLPRKQRNKFSLEDKKHECQVCHKRFLRKSNLVDHLRLHANVKLFKCEYCDKAFVQSGNYKSHIRIHTNEKPFACPICSKAYNQSSALKIHIRTHTNERNYVCDICAKAFTNSSDLTKHKRVHDPSKQFRCPFCKRSFAQKVNLKLHQNNMHRDEICDLKG